MGTKDAAAKIYFSNPKVFAEVINFKVYEGEPVVRPEQLVERDTQGIVVPYGEDAKVPEQRQRDVFKLLAAMEDDNAVYVMVGLELQDKVHYAMAVRCALYDAITYARQVGEAAKSYRSSQGDSGELVAEGDRLKVRLSREEFLSGFRDEDRLVPVVTVVIHLGESEWEGKTRLLDLVEVRDERLRPFLNDYEMNLICPYKLNDEDFEKFDPEIGLGLALKAIKYHKKGAVEAIKASGHNNIERATADFMNDYLNLGLEFEERDGGVNMCEAMERYTEAVEARSEAKGRTEGLAEGIAGMVRFCRRRGMADDEIVAEVVAEYGVGEEYASALVRGTAA